MNIRDRIKGILRNNKEQEVKPEKSPIEKIERTRKKIKSNRLNQAILTGTFIGAGLFASASAQAKDGVQNQEAPQNTTVNTPQSGIKQYIKLVEVNSIPEIQIAMRNNAEYNQLIDAIIYTQYIMKNGSKDEQKQIETINKSILTPDTEDHEKTHAMFKPISEKLYNGACYTLTSDRIKVHMLEEICCFQKQKKCSIENVLKDFKESRKDEFYARHYSNNKIGEIGVALSAENKVPEKIVTGFTQTSTYKKTIIDDKEYYANLFTSNDNKYQTYCLYNPEGDMITSPEILAKSKYPIGTLAAFGGKEIKTANGKTAKVAYASEAKNKHGGWAGFSYFKMDNINKESQGYTFNKAKANFENICKEYAAAAGLTDTEFKAIQGFLNNMDLSGYDLSDNKIKEIKEMYKESSLEQELLKQYNNYNKIVEDSRNDFIAQDLTHLILIKSPTNLISENEAKSINMTAFYLDIAKKREHSNQ